MAKKDVREYFVTMQRQYYKMNKILVDFEKMMAEGTIENEQVEKIRQIVMPLKTNIDRLSYIVYLMDKPKNRKSRKAKKQSKQRAEQYKKFQALNATEIQVEAENEQHLKELEAAVNE